MKVTNRNARQDRAGKHNDRNFNLDNAPHIDQTKLGENIYYTYNGDTDRSFDDIEREFYELNFSEYIKEQNKRNKEARHGERNKTINSYHRSAYTRPEDKILQIGNIKKHASKEELWECALAYKDRFDAVFGEHCKILDMALHMDEATPHVHVRRVWMAEDENGNKFVSQTKALEQLGIMDPDQSKPNSKYNNPKITFTKTDIELFKEVCREKGIQISSDKPKKRPHLSTLEYKRQQIEGEIKTLEEERQKIINDTKSLKESIEDVDKIIESFYVCIETDPYLKERYSDDLSMARKRKRSEQLKELLAIYNAEVESILQRDSDFQTAIIQANAGRELKRMGEFLQKEGLLEKYKDGQKHFLENSKTK